MARSLSSSFSSLILFLGLFPFLRLLPIDARIQPIVVVVSILVLIISRNNWNIPFAENIIILLLISFLTVYAVIGLGKFGIKNVLIEYVSLIAGPILFLCLTSTRNLDILRLAVFKITVYIYIGFGVVEVSPLKQKIFPLLNTIIPLYRPKEASSIFGFRGLSYVAPEPSNAAFILILLLFLFQIFNLQNKGISKVWEVVLIVMAVLNKSGTMLLFLGFYLILFYLFPSKKIKKLWIIIFPVIFSIIAMWLKLSTDNDFNNNRMLQIADRATELTLSGEIFESDNWFLISGPRFAEVATGYKASVLNFFGTGIGSIEQNFTDIIRLVGIDFGSYWNMQLDRGFFDSSKPNSYLSFLGCSSGYFGVVMILALLLMIYKRITNFELRKYRIIGLNLFWMSCLMLLFRSTATIPTPWIFLALIFELQKIEIDESAPSLSQ